MDIIPRSAWGAAPFRGTPKYVATSARSGIMAHWNGGILNVTDHSGCLRAVKSMQDYHQNSHGWGDIGYNLLICQHAQVINGRGIDYQGAHCPNFNRSDFGIQFMVGKDANRVQSITSEMFAAAAELFIFLDSISGKTLIRRGHRDGISTECPGSQAYMFMHSGVTPLPILTPPPPPPVIVANDVILKRGDRGDRVYALQKGALRVFPAYAYPIRRNGGPNGVFGPATEGFVKEFQRRTGMPITGIVDNRTKTKLGSFGVTF